MYSTWQTGLQRVWRSATKSRREQRRATVCLRTKRPRRCNTLHSPLAINHTQFLGRTQSGPCTQSPRGGACLHRPPNGLPSEGLHVLVHARRRVQRRRVVLRAAARVEAHEALRERRRVEGVAEEARRSGALRLRRHEADRATRLLRLRLDVWQRAVRARRQEVALQGGWLEVTGWQPEARAMAPMASGTAVSGWLSAMCAPRERSAANARRSARQRCSALGGVVATLIRHRARWRSEAQRAAREAQAIATHRCAQALAVLLDCIPAVDLHGCEWHGNERCGLSDASTDYFARSVSPYTG